MVSSRWVEGLSTGSRPVSAVTTMVSATNASRLPGETSRPGLSALEETMAARLAECPGIDSANTASKIVGSTMAAMVISRLEPMPPKAVPVSQPARVRATVPKNSRPLPEEVRGGVQGRAEGDQREIAAISSVVPATIAGASANTMVVPLG